jgi:hypothetical protein
MERTQIKSSQIASIGWEHSAHDIDVGTLEVSFTSGATYSYKNVPYNEYRGFLNAESKGTHFAKFIRPCYEFERVHADGCGKYLECTVANCDCFCHAIKKEIPNPDLAKDLKKSIKQVRAKKGRV